MADVEAAYAAATRAGREHVITALLQIWNGLSSWRDADVTAFLQAALPIIAAGVESEQHLVAAYLATQLGESATQIQPIDYAQLRAGVAAEQVYQRPFAAVWKHLADGGDLAGGLKAGAERLASLAATDMQLARTHTARQVMRAAGVSSYRRVLTGKSSCGLCVVASTQRYKVADLLPIHPGCDCTVAPLRDGQQPRQVIDKATLEATHTQIAERFGEQFASRGARGPLPYRDVLITHEHGEIGPVLTVRGHAFTGPTELAAKTGG